MYFVALLLTLNSGNSGHGKMSLAHAGSHAFCAALKDFLLQQCQPGPHDFIKVVCFALNGSQMTFRLTFGDGTPGAPRMLETVLSLSTVLLDQQPYEIASIDLTDAMWSGIGTWNDIAQGTCGSLIRFVFASPLLTVNPGSGQICGAGPLPQLVSLFSRVRQCWTAFGGPELLQDVEQMVQLSGCRESNYCLRTVSDQVEGNLYTGYLGWIEYECRIREAAFLAPLNALARLAFFTGLGELTEYGMGTTAVTITY